MTGLKCIRENPSTDENIHCHRSPTVISTFLHLNMKYSGTISIRAEQQLVPLLLTTGELDELAFK